MPAAIHVHGLTSLQKAFKLASPDLKKELRASLRTAAEPVRRTAELNAETGIRRMTLPWSRMRVGVNQKLVYVAPRKRGTKDARRKRSNVAGLLLDRAMVPALHANTQVVVHELEQMLDTVGRDWERVR